MTVLKPREYLRQALRSSPERRHNSWYREFAAEFGIDIDAIDLRGARSRTRPLRPERDRLHVERGGTSREEAARWTANIREFIKVAGFDAGNLSVRELPKDPQLHAAYREWLYATQARVAGVVVSEKVKGPTDVPLKGSPDRVYIFLPPGHKAARMGSPTPDPGPPPPETSGRPPGSSHSETEPPDDRGDTVFRQLVYKDFSFLLAEGDTSADDVKKRRSRWKKRQLRNR